MLKRTLKKIIYIAMFTMAAWFAHAEDDVLMQAQKLIKNGEFNAAFNLLDPLEASRAGDATYDYLLGIAAVESGHASRGAFALERVLELQPDNLDARAEMAKAHYMLGETASSKTEFNHILRRNPDQNTKAAIQKLLNDIDKVEGNTTTYAGFLEFGGGYDSNVNSAASVNSVSVPALGGLLIPLDKNSRRQSDNYLQLGGGLSVRHPLSERFALFAGINANRRINQEESDFSNTTRDISGGIDIKFNESNRVTLSAQDSNFALGGEDFRRLRGGAAQWVYIIDPRNQIGAYAQYSGLSFDDNKVQNADRSVAGINFGHAFIGDWNPVVYASVYGGQEDARRRGSEFLNQDIVGARAGGQLNFSQKWQGYASLAYENRDYIERDPIFLTHRLDQQYDLSLGANYRPSPLWLIRPQISYSEVDSNIKLNDFDRAIFSITIRKDFNW